MKNQYDPGIVAKHVPREPVPIEVRAAYLRPGELLGRLDAFPVAFLPIGTLEWHGRQNPIGCDAIKAEALCAAVAGVIGGVVMPPVFFSVDAHRDVGHGLGLGMDAKAGFALPGSFYHADPPLFTAILENACRNYLARGFKLVALVSGHNPGLQLNVMNEVCSRFQTPEGREPVIAMFEFSTMDANDPLNIPDHAGFYETSLMMHLTGRVNMDANRGQEIPELAIATNRPLNEASSEAGAQCFANQAESFGPYIRKRLADMM